MPGRPRPVAAGGRLRELLLDAYLRFDRRTLGLSRIFLGFLLVMDLLHRMPVWQDIYSSEGVLPNTVNLAKHGPFSLFNAFSSPLELAVVWALLLATGLCLLVGYRTRVAQLVALALVTSMNNRVVLVQNGGYLVNNLLFLWTALLPLGDRFSIDALLASMRDRRETTAAELNDRRGLVPPERRAPFTTALALVIPCQLAAMYFFNAIHKTGPDWHNGHAVHFVLYANRMVTPLTALVRGGVPNWLVIFLTRSTLVMEYALPVALLSPIGRAWARRAAVALINALHLGFGTVLALGPFAWTCCVFSTLLFSPEDWEVARKTMRRPHRARTVVYAADSGAALWLCRLLARLDAFELLTFRAERDVPLGLAVLEGADALGRGGRRRVGTAAAADAIAALPLGPLVAWLPRLAWLARAPDRELQRLARRGLSRYLGLSVRPRAGPVAPPSPLRRSGRRALSAMREASVLVLFAAAVNQGLVELWVIKRHLQVPQPAVMRLLSEKLLFRQSWFMFAPDPVNHDGTVVVDAVTIDGRHVDPFTGKKPDFDLLHAQSLMDALGSGQIWGDYFNQIAGHPDAALRDAMLAYILRYPERSGREEDQLVSGDVYWVHDENPRWNETTPYDYGIDRLNGFQLRPR